MRNESPQPDLSSAEVPVRPGIKFITKELESIQNQISTSNSMFVNVVFECACDLALVFGPHSDSVFS